MFDQGLISEQFFSLNLAPINSNEMDYISFGEAEHAQMRDNPVVIVYAGRHWYFDVSGVRFGLEDAFAFTQIYFSEITTSRPDILLPTRIFTYFIAKVTEKTNVTVID